MYRRFMLMALVLALVGTPALAQPRGYVEPATMNELVAAAAREGTLTLAAGAVFGGAAGAKAIQDAIEAKYHITFTINYTLIAGGLQYEHQMIQEVQAGQPTTSDVFYSIDSSVEAPFAQVVDWRKYVPNVPADATFYGKRAVALYAELHGYDYNTKLIPPNAAPKSFADLLDPKWKGKIATSPYQGNFINYAGLPEVLGHAGLIAFMTKYMTNVSGIMTCGEIDRVVSGEFAIFGLDCGDYEVHKRQRLGESIGVIYPKEGTLLTYLDPGIPLTAPHPNAARLFIAFLLTRDGQDVLWKVAASDDDKLPGSHYAPVVARLRRQGVKIIDGQMLDAAHPELIGYSREVSAIVNQGR